MIAWALIDKEGNIVKWNCISDGEEGLEIHRTRQLARAACMNGERVVKVMIVPYDDMPDES